MNIVKMKHFQKKSASIQYGQLRNETQKSGVPG